MGWAFVEVAGDTLGDVGPVAGRQHELVGGGGDSVDVGPFRAISAGHNGDSSQWVLGRVNCPPDETVRNDVLQTSQLCIVEVDVIFNTSFIAHPNPARGPAVRRALRRPGERAALP